MRRLGWAAAVTLAAPSLLLPGAASAATPVTSIVIHGRGDGHGVGLPQDGALALGRAGKSAAEILDTFYPGTTLEPARTVRMHVEVWQGPTDAATQIVLPEGGRIYGPAGHIAVPAGGSVTLLASGTDWLARLSALWAGSGGRSVPRENVDDPDPATGDPSPTDTPTDDPAGDASSDPGASAASSSAASDPGDPPSPAASPSTAPAASDTQSAVPTPSATSADPNVVPSAAASQAPGQLETSGRSAQPVPDVTADPVGSAPRLSVTGPELDVVPDNGGVTVVVSSGRSYRGQVLTAPGELVNDVPLELYLRGLGEVRDPGWPVAGLRALVIAARTYALRDALGADDPGDHQHVNICATDACQVYLGAGVEYPLLTEAVESTTGEVLEYHGALAETYYSASAGGETATPGEGFGAGSATVPYLVPVAYDDGGRDGWQRSFDPAAAASALGYHGRLTEIEVTARGPSGRVLAAVLHGSAGGLATTGLALASALGLPSTLFTTGFGIDAPQVAEATSDTTLPALTAASLGAADVPLPVLADAVDPTQAVAYDQGIAFVPPALHLEGAIVQPDSGWGPILWLTLLSLFVGVAAVTKLATVASALVGRRQPVPVRPRRGNQGRHRRADDA